MTTFPSILKWVTAFSLIGLSSPAFSQTFQLSLEEGRVAARQAALQGQYLLARDLALALTDADADDRLALIVLAAVQPQLDAPREGRSAGARAYRLSETDGQRYEAARLTALAAANEERYTLSQFWLRRAAVNAPDDAALSQTRNDYRGVRDLNPWSVNLKFAVTPSDNVNGGTDIIGNLDTDFQFFEVNDVPFGVLSRDSLALPGTSATADVNVSYALSRTPEQTTSVSTRAYARAVWLNDEAKEISPNSRNSDFSSQILEFSLDHRRRAGVGVFSAQALVGVSWFGGDKNRTYVRGRLGYVLPVGERTRLLFNVQAENTSLENVDLTNRERGVSSTLAHFTENGNRITATLSTSRQSSLQPNNRYETVTGQVSYAWADPIGPLQLSVSAGITLSDYPDYSVFTGRVNGGRQDTQRFGAITAVIPDIDYAGFVPVVTFSLQDTESNINRFERDEYSLNIGVRSSF